MGAAWQFLQTYFVTIAAILGTGILGLPVSLAESGYWPFMASFVLCLVAQVGTIWCVVELLQRTDALCATATATETEPEPDPEDNGETDSCDDDGATLLDGDQLAAPEGPRDAAKHLPPRDQLPPLLRFFASDDVGSPPAAQDDEEDHQTGLTTGPNLHAMGGLYLTRWARVAFEAAVYVHFASILISYGLAGSEALGELAGTGHEPWIAPFVCTFSALVVFAYERMRGAISVLTCVKVGMLVLMVGGVGALGAQVGLRASDDWSKPGDPFLLGTVALGGAANVLPVLYARLPHTPAALRRFRTAASLGVATCWGLNCLWALFVLQSVPQTGAWPSLEQAADEGEISTVPVTDVVDADHPSLQWFTKIVNAFILLSIGVSYLTIGSATKHYLDGVVKAAASRAWLRRAQALAYCSTFGLVLLVGALDPSGFLVVLEVFTSLALNLESGLFIAVMFAISRAVGGATGQVIPLPLAPEWARWWPFVALFFLAAAGYDVVSSVGGLASGSGL